MNKHNGVITIGALFAILLLHFTQAQAQVYTQIGVKETVSAHDPFAGQSLGNAVSIRKQKYKADIIEENDVYVQKYYPAEIVYYDRDKNASSIERVSVNQDIGLYSASYNNRAEFSLPVRTINDYTIYIAGKDGKIGRTIGTTHAVLGQNECDRSENRYLAKAEMVNDLLTFAKSPANKAFPVKEIEMVIFPVIITGGFSNYGSSDTSWIQKTGKVKINYGQKVFGAPSVKTHMGEYVVTFYSTDKDPSKYETVVIERNDGLRCKVDKLREVNLTFITDDGEDDSIVVKIIEISDPNQGKFSIIDDTLYDSLMSLKPDTVNNHAIKFPVIRPTIPLFIDETGIHQAKMIWDGPDYEYKEQ